MTAIIAGYKIHEQIYEGQNSLIYRGCQNAGGPSVILKMLKQSYPLPEQVAWFQREYSLTQSLHIEGVIKVHELIVDQHRPVMIVEDFGGESLALSLIKSRQPFSLTEFLLLAIQISDILGRVHQQHVIHKDINPSNLIWNRHTSQLKLIDFGISTALTVEDPVPRTPNAEEGTLAYVSPEQTGRMNRILDYRTDLYSLGVTFYELLTGQLPFPTTDALALMHAHIARQAIPPEKLIPNLSQPLSAIIMKLMSKNAEDRYQSAYGLKADLEECLRQWQTTQRIVPFPLRQQDVVDGLQLSQKLYGRDTEVAVLLGAFDRIRQGAKNFVLVSGPAGIGKSALVREIHKPITQQRGYFITGKFAQFHKNVPYAPFTQALRSLMQQLLTESPEQIALWQEKLLLALTPNGQVVIDIVPELELIIGPQPPVPNLPALDALTRLNVVFQNFICVFAQADHPLVLFLDDLQWADTASLNLLSTLISGPKGQYLLVIGAYRDDEVDKAHPLMSTLEEIRETETTVHCIELHPLTPSHVLQLLVETLHCQQEKTQILADLVFNKTNGNPFFITEFLKSLYSESLLKFDFQSNSWQWDIGIIQARNITDNVIVLMKAKLRNLAPQTQHVLKLAACIGNQFDIQTLGIVHQRLARETANDLKEALAEGLILPLGNAYKLMDIELREFTEEITVEYRFAHDQIQQAAYSLIPEHEKGSLHGRIGRLLLQLSTNARTKNIFDIVNHLNIGKSLIRSQDERGKLAELNLLAGKRAKATAAPKVALEYLQTGLELISEQTWQTQYHLALELHEEATETAYLGGDYERMVDFTTIVLQHANTFLDKVKVYEINIEAGHTEPSRLTEGVDLGLEVLEQLGVSLPRQPSPTKIIQALDELQQTLAGKNINALLDLPEMTDRYKLAAMSVLRKLSTLAYMGVPELFPLINFSAVSLSVRYGNTSLSAWAYAAYGTILCGVLGNFEAGYQFGQLALALGEQFAASSIQANTLFLVNSFIRHWKEHIKETFKPLLDAHLTGLNNGVAGLAALSAYSYVFQAYWSGKELAELEKEFVKYHDVITQLKQETVLNVHRLFHQVVLNLMGQTTNPCQLIGERYDEGAILPKLITIKNVNALCMVYLNKLSLCYLFHDYSSAVEYAGMTEEYLGGAQGQAAVPAFYLYDSLVRLADLPEAGASNPKALLIRVVENQEKMQLWAQHAPMNYLHKFYLVEAERARVAGNDRDAREYYDQAITLAHENGYVNEEALAYELAGRFYLARNQTHLARYYLRDAHYAYLRWGALAKVRDLEHRYPHLIDPLDPREAQPTETPGETTHSKLSLFTTLDTRSVFQAAQAISSEIVLDKLLARLLKIVIENGGAQRGLLILENDGHLVIEAEGTVDTDEVVVLQSVPVESRADLPVTIIRYVHRTKERVVLSNATEEDVFASDPYITAHKPKSILCTPLLKQGQLTGLLYLENSLTAGAFTHEREEVLNLLAAEATISIENASLYRNLATAKANLEDYSKTLELKVEQRTQELQEANSRKSQFLARMSHELRTPMTAILGFTHLVLKKSGDLLPQRQQENLTKVQSSATQLLTLINQLLDLSKIEAGKMEVYPARFDLQQFILSCCDEFSPLLKPNVLLTHDIAKSVRTAHTDKDGLRHVVNNLLSNAIKFTESGEIKITVRKNPHHDDLFEIAVSDAGLGIPANALETIFEEFQQVENAAAKHRGTGLGLPIARRWAELLGGSLRVESELGKGSVFTATLPLVYQAK